MRKKGEQGKIMGATRHSGKGHEEGSGREETLIIDCHAHLTKRPLEGRGAKRELLDGIRRDGVAMTLLMGESVATDTWFSTRELLAQVGDAPGLKVIAGIDVEGDIAAQVEEYAERIRAGRVVGFKLYPGYQRFTPADARLAPVYACAARLGVPVTIHTGSLFVEGAAQPTLLQYSHPLHVDEAATLHPDVTFIIAHLGSPWTIDATEVVKKNPNVYADLSGLFEGRIDDASRDLVSRRLRDAIATLGSAKRLLFGSDWPLIRHAELIAFFEGVIPEEDREAFFSGNAKRLFRLA